MRKDFVKMHACIVGGAIWRKVTRGFAIRRDASKRNSSEMGRNFLFGFGRGISELNIWSSLATGRIGGQLKWNQMVTISNSFKASGQLLWLATLPFSENATPATYDSKS
jgi:hypothetical protein